MNTTQMAAKLYDARDHIKRLYGDGWREKLKPMETIIKDEMLEAATDNSIHALINISKRVFLDPHVKIGLMAAAVQIAEPE